jgi:hypothetical protein
MDSGLVIRLVAALQIGAGVVLVARKRKAGRVQVRIAAQYLAIRNAHGDFGAPPHLSAFS